MSDNALPHTYTEATIGNLLADKANLTEALEICEARCTEAINTFKETVAWEEIATMTARLADMETENLRLRALLNVADINPDSDPQEIRNREIKREQQWYRMEDETERLRAALQPFVEIWRNWCENPDTFQRTISDSLFRRAAQALETEAQP